MSRNLPHWARITKAGSDTGQFHTQQLEYLGKVADGLIVFPYGLHANATPDSLALMFGVQGSQSNRAAFPWTPKKRPFMAAGEVTLYHPETNSVISWRSGGNLEVTTAANVDVTCANLTANVSGAATIDASGSVDITTPTLTLTGNLVVNGTMTNNGMNVGDTHGHTQGNDGGGDTEAPITGVT
jgi:hypothetical protein